MTLNLTCLLVAVPEGMVDGAPSSFQPPAPRGPEARLPLLRVGEEYACEQVTSRSTDRRAHASCLTALPPPHRVAHLHQHPPHQPHQRRRPPPPARRRRRPPPPATAAPRLCSWRRPSRGRTGTGASARGSSTCRTTCWTSGERASEKNGWMKSLSFGFGSSRGMGRCSIRHRASSHL